MEDALVLQIGKQALVQCHMAAPWKPNAGIVTFGVMDRHFKVGAIPVLPIVSRVDGEGQPPFFCRELVRHIAVEGDPFPHTISREAAGGNNLVFLEEISLFAYYFPSVPFE